MTAERFILNRRKRRHCGRSTGAVESLNKSLGHYDRAIALDPKLPEPYFGRALSLEALENFEQAKAAWKKYLEIDNSSKWADEARRRLDELGQTISTNDPLRTGGGFFAAYRAGDRETAGRLLLEKRELIRANTSRLAWRLLSRTRRVKPVRRFWRH